MMNSQLGEFLYRCGAYFEYPAVLPQMQRMWKKTRDCKHERTREIALLQLLLPGAHQSIFSVLNMFEAHL